MRRGAYIALGVVFLGLGAAGVALPLLPGVPLLLISLWAFTRSSPRLEAWLLAHPRYGPPLVAWRAHRVIPLRVKLIAFGSMLASLGIMVAVRTSWLAIAIAASVMGVGAVYIGTRSSTPPSSE